MLAKKTIVAGLLFCFIGAARAEVTTSLGPTFAFHGFGTVGAVHSSEKLADFTTVFTKSQGAGFTRDWSFDPDTRVGLQASAQMSERWSAVLQVVSELRHDNSYRPHVEWANIRYAISPSLSVRAGRIALPLFLTGEHRKVGLTMPWVRPPSEVYGLVPVTNNDGVDATFRFEAGGAAHTLQAYAGGTTVRAPRNIVTKAESAFGASYTSEAGALTTQVFYAQSRLTMGFMDPFFNAFRAFGAEGNAIADRYGSARARARIVGLGLSYEPGPWFVTAEIAKSRSDTWLGDKTGWYVGGGYTIGKFTPYVLVSRIKYDSPTSDPGLSVAHPFAATLNQFLNTVLSMTSNQKTASVGVRWDLAPSAALKLQYDYTDLAPGSYGSFINPQPGFVPGQSVRLVSVVLDFVF